jgi:NitT/TauT family transport system ATP-binding protein
VNEPLIRLRNVRKTYSGQGFGSPAISDVTFNIAEGALVSVVGPFGCGKTTLLKILADLHQADDGGVQIGNPTSHFAPGRDVGR